MKVMLFLTLLGLACASVVSINDELVEKRGLCIIGDACYKRGCCDFTGNPAAVDGVCRVSTTAIAKIIL